jgi:hypothetical protein
MVPDLSTALPAGLISTSTRASIAAGAARREAKATRAAARRSDDIDTHDALMRAANALDAAGISLQTSHEMCAAVAEAILLQGR